ncbi:CPBP family intramembrane glutamic endopeptidase [Stenotrophomonas mori]|uniref:CPBP family intramembrane metalloprotease n=1 Tax=Stenotrophomonas mori TaxID=2871096 RepID=A0ABT0SIE8_9GAMM|nr:CPBP family intramembrane glutamic endopeptidase [Stenotrophomonas mori]MCL7714853.1 CPBP family intramembrane metalloprotease [Stenotrophomonas mori]
MTVPSPLRPSRPASPPVPAPTGSPVLGFGLDVLLATVLLMGLSLLCGLFWGLWRGFMVGVEAARAGQAPDVSAFSTLGQPGALAQMLIALVATGGTALALYLWRRRATPAERAASRHAVRRGSTWGWTLLVAAGVFVGSSLAGWLGKQLGVEPVPTNLSLMEEALARYPVFLVVFAVLLAPAYEELLFRRVLFGRLWAAGRPWLGMLLSGAAFAFIHEIPGTSANGPAEIAQLWLVYGGMGIAFAWLYRRTGTLWAAIVAHGLNNAIALAALVFLGVP